MPVGLRPGPVVRFRGQVRGPINRRESIVRMA
nr:MAG TPA: hypothetical protein [Caudoviricetes sp.]